MQKVDFSFNVFDRNQINWNKEGELWISLSNQAPPETYMLICYFKHFNAGDGYIYILISRAWSEEMFVSLWEEDLVRSCCPCTRGEPSCCFLQEREVKGSVSLCALTLVSILTLPMHWPSFTKASLISSPHISLYPIYYTLQTLNA